MFIVYEHYHDELNFYGIYTRREDAVKRAQYEKLLDRSRSPLIDEIGLDEPMPVADSDVQDKTVVVVRDWNFRDGAISIVKAINRGKRTEVINDRGEGNFTFWSFDGLPAIKNEIAWMIRCDDVLAAIQLGEERAAQHRAVMAAIAKAKARST